MRADGPAAAGCLCALLLATSAASGSAQTVTFDRRPTVHVPGGELELRARVDGVVLSGSKRQGLDGPDAEWQTRRIEVDGTFFQKLEFELAYELGDSVEPEGHQYVNYRFSRRLEIRAGRFKIPFSRDQLTSGGDLDFVVRSMAARQIAPGRDVGVMVHGRTRNRAFSYQAGYFDRDGTHARTSQTEGGHDAIAARVVIAPFVSTSHRVAAPLQLGVNVVTSRLDNLLGLRGETVFEDGVFFDRSYVNGRRLRHGLDAAWSLGPVSLTAERDVMTDERLAMGLAGEDLPKIRATGWYVAGTWTVTGETKDGRVEPRESLFDGGWGAVQLAGRVERLAFGTLDEAANAMLRFGAAPPDNHDRVTTVGVAWYLNRYFKVQGNLVHEAIADPARSPAPNAGGRLPRGVLQFQFVL
ncbi:MAG TPA: porin [Gemmatimonadaceae bacterium]|nr:porin [Gemmatimonadaceae bacterium]